MARYWPMHAVVLIIFLAATVDCVRTSESEAIPKKRTFLEKFNNLASLVDRSFRSVESDIKTLYGNFDLIGRLAADKLPSSLRTLESLKRRGKPIATTPHPDVTTPQPDVTTPQPDVTMPPVVSTSRPVATEACGDWAMYGASSFSFCTCTQPCSFNSARNKCREKQAELAKVASRELENFLLSLKTPQYILLGGNDRVEEGTWRWPDGSLLNESYTNWWRGQPNGRTRENCLAWYAPAGKWYDTSCDNLYSGSSSGFLCEKKHHYM